MIGVELIIHKPLNFGGWWLARFQTHLSASLCSASSMFHIHDDHSRNEERRRKGEGRKMKNKDFIMNHHDIPATYSNK